MKIPLSWIEDYLSISEPVDQVADLLTFAGIEVEGIEEGPIGPIFDCGLTPNLGHCFSVLGIARELSALLQRPLKKNSLAPHWSSHKTEDLVSVRIEDPEGCDLYGCMLIEGVSSYLLPEWLVQRLEACGVRRVSPLVDVGNYVMLELGQPLHLFDFDRLASASLSIEQIKEAEEAVLLQGAARLLHPGTLVVREGREIGAIAGVLGAARSAVSEKTDRILVEAAHFTPSRVRASAKKLRLQTESSMRFERGTDPYAVKVALERMAALLCQNTPAVVYAPMYTVEGKKGVFRSAPSRVITLHPERANHLIGLSLSVAEIIAILARLEIILLKEKEGFLEFSIPSYRNDLKVEVDLIEEIARVFGFQHIVRRAPKHISSSIPDDPLYRFEEEARRVFVAQGLQESLTCDLISPKLADITIERAMRAENQIHVLYPASEDQSILRTSLLPGLLNMVKFNLDRQSLDIAAFEVGHLYFKIEDRYIQETAAGLSLTGQIAPYHYAEKEREVDFFHLKGHIESFLANFGVFNQQIEVSHLHNFHPGRQAVISLEEERVGAFGEIHPAHLRLLGIDQKVYYGELNLYVLLRHSKICNSIQPVAVYPGSSRDWTITLSEQRPVGAIIEAISEISSSLLEKVFLLDLYKSDKIGEDKKNVTFRFQYRDLTRTVSYQEVEEEHHRILEIVEQSILCKEV